MTIDEDISRLIPQRDPIRMVDRLTEIDGETAKTVLTVKADNYFIDDDGLFSETGLIEHIAQSASAFAGYVAITAGAKEAPVGYIGEIKRLRVYRRPRVGEELHTSVTMGAEIEGVRIVQGETCVSGETVASTQLKIFIPARQR